MDSSLWEDEAQLANIFLEESSNRSSSESSGNGFHFNSTAKLKKNLTATFDQELSHSGSFGHIPHSAMSQSQSSLVRPPIPNGTQKDTSRKQGKKVAVYLRIRPTSKSKIISGDVSSYKNTSSTIEIINPAGNPNCHMYPTTIRTYPPVLSNTRKVNVNRNGRDAGVYAKEFHFDRVMGPETSQQSMYAAVAAPMIDDLFHAREQTKDPSQTGRESALLFSYGVTNAGKTYTVLGDINSTNRSNWGIIPRAINDIFERVTATQNVISVSTCTNQRPNFNLLLSFFEIYNEQIFDLMPSCKVKSNNVNNSLNSLKVRECRGQIFVRGLAKHKVCSVEHGIALTKEAHNKRHTSSNNLNSDSSRSHFICQMQLFPSIQSGKSNEACNCGHDLSGYTTEDEALATSKVAMSTIWIVDLAGSERSKRTQVGVQRQKESTKINSSLMTLMRCLNAMKNNGKHGNGTIVMPFRDSKLTHIFMEHLTSKSAVRTAMMVNVNPSIQDFDETQHVLAYSRKAKLIEIDAQEYGLKRKEIFGDEYDQNGRKKVRYNETDHVKKPAAKNPKTTSLLSHLVKKLSPKRTTNKTQSGPSEERSKHVVEINTLKKSLQVVETRAKRLEEENLKLIEELNRTEEQIRAEVATEMEELLRETRTKHNEKYEHLRSAVNHQATNAGISVSMDLAGNQIEELMDKIEECEKEIIRMTKNHNQTIEALKDEVRALNEKDKQSTKKHAENSRVISHLEQELERRSQEIIKLKNNKTSEKDSEPKKVFPQWNEEKVDKSSKQKQFLRPRKPFGNTTNQSVGSRVFNVSVD